MSRLKHLYVVSAPSGAGKTSLNKRLAADHEQVEISVSLTTRAKREGEVHGRDYYFVSKDEFERAIAADEMLEWANVHGNLYGTSRQHLREIAGRGHVAILEIDVQGWLAIRPKLERVTSIFIVPMNLKQLWNRLENRGTDPIAKRWTRLQNAKGEIAAAEHYDRFVVNDHFDDAYRQLAKIVTGDQVAGLDPKRGRLHCKKLLEEFETEEWIKDLAASLAMSGALRKN